VGSLQQDNVPSVWPLEEAGIGRAPASRKQERRRRRARFRLLHVAVLALIGLILMAWIAPHSSQPASSAQIPARMRTGAQPAAPTPGGLHGGVLIGQAARTADGPGPPPQAPPTRPTAPASGGNCISFPGGIDFGACLAGAGSALGQLLSGAFSNFIDWVTSFGFMFITPPGLTYHHGVVINLWVWALGVADAALALFLVIGGYNAMLRHSLGATYPSVLEFLPRILLAAVAANFSLSFISSFIELNNALCLGVQGALATAGAGTLSLPFSVLNILTLPFYAAIAYLIELAFAALLSVQMLVRIALLDLLTVLSPLWLLMLGLKQTERWGKLGAAAFATTLFLQFLQILVLGIGSALISSFGHASLTPITILVGIASLYLAFRLPGMLYGAVLRPVEGATADAANAGERIATILAT
jgi:hypothetical protein